MLTYRFFIYFTHSLWAHSLWEQACRSITLNTVCGDKSVVQLLYTQFMGTSLWCNYFTHSLWGQICGAITLHTVYGDKSVVHFFTHSLWDRSAVNLLYAQFVRQIFISIAVHTTLGWLTYGRKLQNWCWEIFPDSFFKNLFRTENVSHIPSRYDTFIKNQGTSFSNFKNWH